jgi:hypothetical protein
MNRSKPIGAALDVDTTGGSDTTVGEPEEPRRAPWTTNIVTLNDDRAG